ncbi:MAG TPA: hypothetical protein VKA84_21675 [Gemmatimonadaceae bacterium]|nr:hypothetical protein [Gemmatimonadaceae bacterium]
MRRIPTRVHGILDYSTGALLMALPGLLKGARRGRAEAAVPVALGVGALLYSLFTDYELGAVRKLPMKVHLALDVASGIFFAASPWVLDLDEDVRAPYLALGLWEIAAGLMTEPEPIRSRPAVPRAKSQLRKLARKTRRAA